MTLPPTDSGLPEKAARLFRKTLTMDWSDGISLKELLSRVNKVAVHLAPQESTRHTRVKSEFTERSFRHYQTLGCIHSPDKSGKRVSYGQRHFVQALLVRKLLLQRHSSEQIAALVEGRGAGEIERMLSGGIEMVARKEADSGAPAVHSPEVTTWKRVELAPGIELHLRGDRRKLKREERTVIVANIEAVLSKN